MSSTQKKFDFSIESLLRGGPMRKNIDLVEKLSPRDSESFREKRINSKVNVDLGNLTPSEIVIDRNCQGCEESEDEEGLKVSVDEESVHDSQTFSWLHCTRFKPPKLPRSKKRGNVNKRLGRGPRIPFSPHQIAVLENTFGSSQYLSGDCINRLADALHLSDTRVKIWFQNRRARYRREKDAMGLDKTGVSGSDQKTLTKASNSTKKAILNPNPTHPSSTPILRKSYDNNYSTTVVGKDVKRRHETTNNQEQEKCYNTAPLSPQKSLEISSRSSTSSANSLFEGTAFEGLLGISTNPGLAELQFHLGCFQVGNFADFKYLGERMQATSAMDLCSIARVHYPNNLHSLSAPDAGGNSGAYQGGYDAYCKHNGEGCGINHFSFSSSCNEGSQYKDLEVLRLSRGVSLPVQVQQMR